MQSWRSKQARRSNLNRNKLRPSQSESTLALHAHLLTAQGKLCAMFAAHKLLNPPTSYCTILKPTLKRLKKNKKRRTGWKRKRKKNRLGLRESSKKRKSDSELLLKKRKPGKKPKKRLNNFSKNSRSRQTNTIKKQLLLSISLLRSMEEKK